MQGTFPFTYKGFEEMILLLQQCNYHVANYHTWEKYDRPVILRHDIDNSVEKAVHLAALEKKLGVTSTYFVLLTSDFYNILSNQSQHWLHEIQSYGHEIGLHFDEKNYPDSFGDPVKSCKCICREAKLLEDVLGCAVTTVSMHRPSREMLESNLQIPGIINSYGTTFFKDFKYLSDSRHRWREPVADIIKSKKHPKLHILTHALSWNQEDQGLVQWVRDFIGQASVDRWKIMNNNFTDLESIVSLQDVCMGMTQNCTMEKERKK